MKNKNPRKLSLMRGGSFPGISTEKLIAEIRSLIDSARNQVANAFNAGLVMLYWGIGQRLQREVLKDKRAEYGKQIFYALSRKLVKEYGAGFSQANLFHMARFAEVYPKMEVVQTLATRLSWTHLRQIIYLEPDLKRDFYAEMCRLERWSTRTLDKKIGGMLYERTALSKKPAKLVKKELAQLREDDRLSPDLVFRDPYFLDFLGLKDTYSEKDIEMAILRELERFLVELGTDFTFVARQKRMAVGKKDYYLDLLFYHRGMRCLVAIELKLGEFTPGDMGQMELYLRWLEKYDMKPGENPPIGLILCGQKNHEDVELLRLGKRGIRVAEYMTELPPRKVLERKLHDAIQLAQKQLDNRKTAS